MKPCTLTKVIPHEKPEDDKIICFTFIRPIPMPKHYVGLPARWIVIEASGFELHEVTGTAESLEVTHRPGRNGISTKPEMGVPMRITVFARVARVISSICIAKEGKTRKFKTFCFFDFEGSSCKKPFTLANVNPHEKAESESRPLGNHVLWQKSFLMKNQRMTKSFVLHL